MDLAPIRFKNRLMVATLVEELLPSGNIMEAIAIVRIPSGITTTGATTMRVGVVVGAIIVVAIIAARSTIITPTSTMTTMSTTMTTMTTSTTTSGCTMGVTLRSAWKIDGMAAESRLWLGRALLAMHIVGLHGLFP